MILTPLQRAGAAFATANLWGQTGLPTADELAGFGYVSLPVGPTSDLAAYQAAARTVKTLGRRVHVVVHHDGQAGYAYWPYKEPDQFVEFNRDLASRLAPILDRLDTWEPTNEASANPALGDTWKQQLPLYQVTLPKARDAVRAAGVVAMTLCPVPGDQGPAEAANVQDAKELPLAVYQGWDGIGCHYYAPSSYAALDGSAARNFSNWALAFQNLADAVGLPWVATEYGYHNARADGPRALLAMRSQIEACAAVGTCLGGIVWQLRTYDPPTCIGNNPAALAAVGDGPPPPSRPVPA